MISESALWLKAHSWAITLADSTSHVDRLKWIEEWENELECEECRVHYQRLKTQKPPDLNNLFEWFVWLHDEVNALLGKERWGVEKARKNYIKLYDWRKDEKAVEAATKSIPSRKTICASCENFGGFLEGDAVTCKIGKICCGGRIGEGPLSVIYNNCPAMKWCQAMFDRVYVVSLDRTPERLEAFKERMSKIDYPFKPFQVFRAMDGDKLPTPSGITHQTIKEMRINVQKSIRDLPDLKMKGEILIALSAVTDVQNKWEAGGGAWGCMESHRAILRECIMDGVESVLIFEDDAEPIATFNESFKNFIKELPPDWDGLMLGGQHFGTAPVQIVPGIVKSRDCGRTHAYGLRGKMLRDTYAMWHSFFNHCDYALGPFTQHYKVYAPDPFLFGQGVNQSQITGRLEPKRFWSGKDQRMKVVLFHCTPEIIKKLRALGVHTGYSRDPKDVDSGLNAIFKSNATFNEKLGKLRSWIETVSREAAAFSEGICGIWFPDLDQIGLQLIRLALGQNFKELRVNSVENFLEQRDKYALLTPDNV